MTDFMLGVVKVKFTVTKAATIKQHSTKTTCHEKHADTISYTSGSKHYGQLCTARKACYN
jgi:hypothetical protein